ncbi:MAG TPA: polyphosphate kinase 1 [Bryobacteraceae bacterium]|nr:polyphosphate kinase 1 [Bryobacteraceae bacterium]
MTNPAEGLLSTDSLEDPKLYINRELSLLAFQDRVLEEARDPANPLLERVKFLSIFGSNIDELFMIRVASLQHQRDSGTGELTVDGLSASDQLQAICREAGRLMREAYEIYNKELVPALAQEGIEIVDYSSLSESERLGLDKFFRDTVFPVLTPLGYDPGRPFPHISNLSLSLGVVLRDRSGVERFARVKVPDTLDQLIAVPGESAERVRFVWLEQIISANLSALFPGTKTVDAYNFRVTRDAEMEIQELESDDLLETIEEAVWQRRFRHVVRLELDRELPPKVMAILAEELGATTDEVYYVPGPLGLTRLSQLTRLDRPKLKYKPFTPSAPPDLHPTAKEDIFGLIRRGDVLLHHPFESFQPVVDFLQTAALDPEVLAIKIALYRVGRNSPIVKSLLTAVEEGKQVSVLVELKARFDEESNIEWTKALESHGVHVIYGLVGLKVHSKIALVVRREGTVMRKYVHLGTGNYNPTTAKLYTDLSLMTCDEAIGNDAVTLFNRLTGYSEDARYSELLVAPDQMRKELIKRIEREIAHSERGTGGHIIAKMNALEDPDIIRWLYRASAAGVKVDLIVRGICCLRPGIPGVSENIRVRSILGRFLEHSRISWFRNGGSEEVLVGSADWMTRNLSRRVEVLFPIHDPRLVKRLREVLDIYLADNVSAREMQADGSYVRLRRDGTAVEAQSALLEAATKGTV